MSGSTSSWSRGVVEGTSKRGCRIGLRTVVGGLISKIFAALIGTGGGSGTAGGAIGGAALLGIASCVPIEETSAIRPGR